ncbi:pancreatic secretory granule membrane major glycoprotein GP2-like [Pelobates fuscus]|uniref:pancreatic secretory granule membrane major glycoprotein GP2-like n=1 Tax=Pelobates fuscus TaxID=191477 RepID=UPI002FE443DD
MIFLCILVLAATLIEKGSAECYVIPSDSGLVMCSDNSCGGQCYPDIGCFCSDQAKQCLPTNSECTPPDNICCPTGYFWSSVDNCCTTTAFCYPSCHADEICENVNNVSTCNCNTTKYAGIKISALVPSVHCDSKVMEVSINKCLVTSLGFDSTSLTLNDASQNCSTLYPTTTDNVTVVTLQSKPVTGWCGTVMKTDSSKVYYTNTLHIGILNKTIITTNPINISFTCSYNLTMQTSLVAALHPVLSSVNLTVNGEGSVLTTMAAYWGQAYSDPIQSTDEVPVGSPFYLGLFSESTDGDTFVLRVDDCFGTPDGDNNSVNKVMLVSGGCPANQGVGVDVEENGQSLQARIKINSFVFQSQPLVYITCNVRLCFKNATCTGCNVARSAESETSPLTISVNFLDSFSDSASSTASSWTMLAGSLFTFLSMKFF